MILFAICLDIVLGTAARRNAENSFRRMTNMVQAPIQRLVLRGGGRKNRDEDEDDEDEVSSVPQRRGHPLFIYASAI